MRIETDETLVMLVAEDDAEVKMLEPLAGAINKNGAIAQLVDNLENGPDKRVINGILQIQIS